MPSYRQIQIGTRQAKKRSQDLDAKADDEPVWSYRRIQIGSRQAQKRRECVKDGPPLSNNQVMDVPKLPFPRVVSGSVVFPIGHSKVANRLRSIIIANRSYIGSM